MARSRRAPARSIPGPRLQTDKAEKLSLSNVEGHRSGAAAGEASDRNSGAADGSFGLDEELVGLASDDHSDQLIRRRIGYRLLPDQLAIAQHSDAIGDPEDLIQSMRDIDHRNAPLLERTNGRKQLLDFIGRQAGRRFVEDKYIGFDGKRAGYRDKGFFGSGQFLDRVDGSKSQPTSLRASAVRRSVARQSISRARSE